MKIDQYGCFESFPFHQNFFFRLPAHMNLMECLGTGLPSARPHDFDGMLGTGLPVSMYTTKTPIDMWRFNIPQLKEFLFLAFSVNDRYQLNYLFV
jgi:hypothetical protein